MPTPSGKVYTEEHKRKRREGMQRYREMYPERVTASDKRHYNNNRENRIAHVAKWAKSNPEKVATAARKCHLKLNYGITPEQWSSLFDSQGRCCPICKSSNPSGKNPWDVDHDHSTGSVRGILCHHCNVLLGMAKDDIAILTSAIDYLRLKP